jgi:hypothetical protein
MSAQDHTTAYDGQTLDQQDPSTQELFFGTWGNWARVRWVLEHNHLAGQSDAVPVVDPQDARSNNLPGGIPCAGGSQCASGVCAAPVYVCATQQVDKSKIDPRLQNPGALTTGGTSPPTNASTQSARQPDMWAQLQAWPNAQTLIHGLLGPTAPQISNWMIAAGGGLALLLMSGGGHHRRGLL